MTGILAQVGGIHDDIRGWQQSKTCWANCAMNAHLFPNEKQLCTAKVLIIDDEDTYVRALDWLLRQAKFRHLRGLTRSTLAREEFLRFQPDLVVLDLHMPELDGFAVLEQLRQSVPAGEFLPVLAMTGYNAADTRSRALAAGATDFLSKPFDNNEVILRIRNLLQTRFLYKQAREIQTQLEALSAANKPPATPGQKP